MQTVYGGAHLFKADTAPKMGRMAFAALTEYAKDALEFAQVLDLPGTRALRLSPEEYTRAEERFLRDEASVQRSEPALWLALSVFHRVNSKLKREGVEDFRIDFEDGFGSRPDSEEDEVALAAARETARGLRDSTLPPYIGIRIKSLGDETRLRALRTLDLYLAELSSLTKGLPPNFVVTLPKITSLEQVATFARVLDTLESKLKLAKGSLKFEVMIETTQSLIDGSGRFVVPLFQGVARGRLVGAHFGVYDYTAGVEITAAHQSMDHPACDFARGLMKIGFAGQPVFLSDGATNVMPVGPHRASTAAPLTQAEENANRAAVHRAWKVNYDHVRHSLRQGFYQGWDLHPNQLPIRYAACYSFFLEGLEAATARLKSFMAKAAQATLLGEVFDDAATGQGLLNFFLRAHNCGAITQEEVLKTGLSWDDVTSRSFLKILERRRQ